MSDDFKPEDIYRAVAEYLKGQTEAQNEAMARRIRMIDWPPYSTAEDTHDQWRKLNEEPTI